MTNWFIPLKETDIEEKLKLEKESGRDLKTTKKLLKGELFHHEREILKTKYFLNELPWYKFIFKYRQVMRVLLPLEIQAQNLREQIAYINKKIS